MSRSTRLARLLELFGLEGLLGMASEKRVPRHRQALWYYFGGMALFLFVVQVVTGILLLLYYRPSADEAHESVEFLMQQVRFGWLVRSLHAWAANLLIGVLMLHMITVFLLKAYRPPREGTWLTGVALFAIFLAFGFSGYLLPWTDLSFFATKVGTEIPRPIPWIGPMLVRFLRGGDEVTGGTLTRFFGFHVAVLPAITTAILGIHLLLVQKKGMSVPPWIEKEHESSGKPIPTMPFVPDFLLRDLFGWLLALGGLAALAALWPWELLPKADPLGVPGADIAPEWYFLWMFQTLRKLPRTVLGIEGELFGIAGFSVLAVFWVLVPWLDRGIRRERRSALFTWIGLLLILYVVGMTFWSLLGQAP